MFLIKTFEHLFQFWKKAEKREPTLAVGGVSIDLTQIYVCFHRFTPSFICLHVCPLVSEFIGTFRIGPF